MSSSTTIWCRRALLQHARRGAELIDVGTAAPQPMAQEAISYLLAEKAREGKRRRAAEVGRPVRLRSRRRRGAVPARAGRAVRGRARRSRRHRRAGLRRHSGHAIPAAATPSRSSAASRTTSRDAARRRLGQPGAARRHRRLLCRRAAAAAHPRRAASARLARRRTGGASSTTARCRRRRRVTRHRRRAARRSCSEQPRREPAILVVGRVVGFREHLRWFDARPLFGRRVLVTRPREQAAELVGSADGARRRCRSRRR